MTGEVFIGIPPAAGTGRPREYHWAFVGYVHNQCLQFREIKDYYKLTASVLRGFAKAEPKRYGEGGPYGDLTKISWQEVQYIVSHVLTEKHPESWLRIAPNPRRTSVADPRYLVTFPADVEIPADLAAYIHSSSGQGLIVTTYEK